MMTPISFRPPRLRDADPVIVIAVMFLPLGWGTLFDVGQFSLEPFHVSMLAVAGLTFLRIENYARAFNIIRYNWLFFAGFGLYFFLQFFSYSQTHSAQGLDYFVIKQAVFLVFGTAVAVRILTCRSITLSLCLGGALSIVAFLIAISLSAALAGTSLWEGFSTLIATGNYQTWTFVFLRRVFNAFSMTGAAAEEFITSLKNNIGTGLLISFLCYRAGMTALKKTLTTRVFDYTASFLFFMCILMMLSRSVMLSLIICVMIVVLIDAVVRNNGRIVITILAIGVAGAVLFLALPETFIEAMENRFSDTGSFESRVEVYEMAIPRIENRFWWGWGIGAPLEGESIHNLFLSAWFNAGVFAFFASVWFWVVAVAQACQQLLVIMRGRYSVSHQLVLFHAWIAVIPITGLFRCWLIGGGVLNFSAWFSLGVFFGVLYRDAMARAAQPAPLLPGGAFRPLR